MIDLKRLKLLLPTLQEQIYVNSFLNLLDTRLQKQREKVELLKQQKKGLMQKIFSQELRVKDEDEQDYP